ncbi:MAG TPA: hypothetical protein PLW02_04390 [Verrucomicrobiota bacterium]|nr:hypothetical protein [Verrucomicrobiota bacterium]
MIATKKYRHLQKTLLLICVVLGIYTFAVYLPLNRWVKSFDNPIEQNLNVLNKKFPLTVDKNGIDISPLEKNIKDYEEIEARLDALKITVEKQIAFSPQVVAKLKQPFQLVEYQNERQLCQEELQAAASKNLVTIYPGVLANYPEYSSDMKNPELLWAYLSMVHNSLLSAINSRITSINSLTIRAVKTIAYDDKTNSLPTELHFRLTISGNSQSVSKFITLLPAKYNPEVKDASLGMDKPELYIDRILIKKDGIEDTDNVMAELRICGFVLITPKKE